MTDWRKKAWIDRWQECKGTENETDCLISLYEDADKYRAVDDISNDIYVAAYDATQEALADRPDFVASLEYSLCYSLAEEQYGEAAYGYDFHSGRDAGDSTSPFWDKDEWIARRTEQILADRFGVAP